MCIGARALMCVFFAREVLSISPIIGSSHMYSNPRFSTFRHASLSQCANVRLEIDSALEPTVCQYHMVMRSWYGCPTQCPITSTGLCSSHGHCAYDPYLRQPYCYCNEGFVGEYRDALRRLFMSYMRAFYVPCDFCVMICSQATS